jgi:hypothetical protein
MCRSRKQSWRSIIAIIVFIVGLMVPSTTPVARADDDEPDVFEPQSSPYGKTYGEWSAKWWQWLLAIPKESNPNLDTTGANCGVGQSGKVWFLAGTFGGPATRTCTIPRKKALLFPVLCTAYGASAGDCEPSVPGKCDVGALREGAASQEDSPKLLEAILDGEPILHPRAFRAMSQVFSITLPEKPAIDSLAPAVGTFSPNVSDGYWIMLEPLSPGHHTLHVRGITNDLFGNFEAEVMWNLIIQ